MPIRIEDRFFYNSTEDKRKAVILLHGFNSSKEEVANFYLTLSAGLIEKGVASYSPDLFLEKGKMLPLVRQYDILLASVEFLRSEGYREIAICGFSLGSFLAMKAAQALAIQKIILLSPLFSLKNDFTGFLGFNIPEMLSAPSEDISFNQEGVGYIDLPKAFLRELQDLSNDFVLDSGELLAISGDEDFSASNHARIAEKQTSSLVFSSHIFPKTDHIFNAFRPGEEKTAEVISMIRDFV